MPLILSKLREDTGDGAIAGIGFDDSTEATVKVAEDRSCSKTLFECFKLHPGLISKDKRNVLPGQGGEIRNGLGIVKTKRR